MKIIFIAIISILGGCFSLLTFLITYKANLKQTMYKYFLMEIFFETISLFFIFFDSIIFNSIDALSDSIRNKLCKLDFRLSNSLVLEDFKIHYADFIILVSVTCSVCSNFFMSFDRYIFITNNKKFKWFVGPKNIHIKVFVFVLTFGVFVNSNQGFVCVYKGCKFYRGFVVNALNFIYILQDLIYLLLIIMAFVINMALVKFLKQTKEKKEKLTSKNNKTKQLKKSSKTNKSENLHKKTLMMIILQCVLMVLCRIPDFVLSIYKIKLQFLKNHSISHFIVWLLVLYSTLLPEYQLVYLIIIHFSYILNCIIVFFFNRKLRNALKYFLDTRKFKKYPDNDI